MVSDSDVRGARAEMEYRQTPSEVFEDRTLSTSIPCQLRFTSTPEQDVDRFHAALEERSWADLDADPAWKSDGEQIYYKGEVAPRSTWNRISVLVSRGNCVRLYPKDEYVPTEDELRTLIEALEDGYDAELKHDAIDHDD